MKDIKKREMPEKFASKLKFFRTIRGYSLEYLANMTQTSASYINRLERGERKAPSYPIVKKLADALNIEVYDLIDVPVPEVTPIRDILEFILWGEFTIQGKVVSRHIKESLMELLQTVLEAEWNEGSKYKESIQIMEKVNDFLKAVN